MAARSRRDDTRSDGRQSPAARIGTSSRLTTHATITNTPQARAKLTTWGGLLLTLFAPQQRMQQVGQIAFWGGMTGVQARQSGGVRNLYGANGIGEQLTAMRQGLQRLDPRAYEIRQMQTPDGQTFNVVVRKEPLEAQAMQMSNANPTGGGNASGTNSTNNVSSNGIIATGFHPSGISVGKDPASLIQNGRIDINDLMEIIPSGTANTWRDFSHIKDGAKYQFSHNGTQYTIHFHEPDSTAPTGSNAATDWIVRIKVGNRWLMTDGTTTRNTTLYANETHIPLDVK